MILKTVQLLSFVIFLIHSPYAMDEKIEERQNLYTHFVLIPNIECGGIKAPLENGILTPGVASTGSHVTVFFDEKTQALRGAVHGRKFPNVTYAISNFNSIGQDNRVASLKQTMAPLLQNDQIQNMIVWGSGLGTLPALLYTAENPTKIKALILEEVIGSLSNTICHWLPYMNLLGTTITSYLAKKLVDSSYDSSGPEPIDVAHKIPTDIPVIIIHSARSRLPVSDVDKLCNILCHQGNTHVYFFPIEGAAQYDLLKRGRNDREIAAINLILKQFKLPYDQSILDSFGEDKIDLALYNLKMMKD